MFHTENGSLNRDRTEMTEVEPAWNSQAEGIDKDCLFSNGAETICQRSLSPIIKEIWSQTVHLSDEMLQKWRKSCHYLCVYMHQKLDHCQSQQSYSCCSEQAG